MYLIGVKTKRQDFLVRIEQLHELEQRVLELAAKRDRLAQHWRVVRKLLLHSVHIARVCTRTIRLSVSTSKNSSLSMSHTYKLVSCIQYVSQRARVGNYVMYLSAFRDAIDDGERGIDELHVD